jgi:branched-chain amino acid transport system permease protein
MNYLIHLLIYLDIYLVVALSLNLVVGYCGMLTLAHAGYYAVGGYVYALLTLVGGWSFLPAIAAAVVVAALLSLAVSLPSWRLKGDYFVLASLAVQALLFSLVYNWSDASSALGSWRNLTNGPFGISGIPKPEILGVRLVSPPQYLGVATAIAALTAFVVWRLTGSPWGRVLTAMREDELAARGLGKNTRLLKVQAFAISCGLVAVAGALYAAYVSYLDPSSASLDESILMLSMVVVGGVGNFRGPVVGATFLVALPELLRFLELPDAQAANVRLGLYGLMLVLMMHFRPQGISGEYRLN